jgi:uncharacterized protein YecT (DUF1311 family)
MRYVLLGVVFSAGAVVAAAADSGECNPAGTQLELNACAADDFAKADKELNEAYAELLKDKGKDKVFVRKVRAAQKAWLTFRDAELEALFACEDQDPRVCWGSMYPMSYMSEKTRLTQERTQALRAILHERQEN